MSQSPGIMYFPVESTTFAPAGASTAPAGPTAVIRPPATVTERSVRAAPFATSITVTCWNTIGLALGNHRLGAQREAANAGKDRGADEQGQRSHEWLLLVV